MVNFSGLQFHDGAPVYQQIAEYLKRQILTGAVQDGDPMPSRRELAAQTGINPNTAQKAYRLMTEEGYVVTDGNSGSYLRLTPALRPCGGFCGPGQSQPTELQKGHCAGQRALG